MRENIDILLEKLSHDSIAHDLVDTLKKLEQQDWPEVLDDFLRSRMEQKVQELMHGEDQEPRG